MALPLRRSFPIPSDLESSKKVLSKLIMGTGDATEQRAQTLYHGHLEGTHFKMERHPFDETVNAIASFPVTLNGEVKTATAGNSIEVSADLKISKFTLVLLAAGNLFFVAVLINAIVTGAGFSHYVLVALFFASNLYTFRLYRKRQWIELNHFESEALPRFTAL